MNIRKKIIPLFLFISFISAMGATLLVNANTLPKPTAAPLDQVVAIVNNTPITQSQLDKALQQSKLAMQASEMPAPNSTNALKKTVLNRLIDEQLQLQIAERNNISVSNQQVNQAILRIAKNNKMTLSQFKTVISQQGLSWRDYTAEIRKQMTISKVQQSALSSQVTITDTDIENYRNQYQNTHRKMFYHVVDYWVATPDNATQQQINTTRAKAEQLKRSLQRGIKPTIPYQQNDLGEQALNNLPALFAPALKNLRNGQYSSTIVAPNGVHVLLLKSTRVEKPSLSDAQIRQMLFVKRSQRALNKWLKELRSSAYVKIY